MVLMLSLRSMSSQGHKHFKVKVILESNGNVFRFLSPKQAVGFRPNAYLSCLLNYDHLGSVFDELVFWLCTCDQTYLRIWRPKTRGAIIRTNTVSLTKETWISWTCRHLARSAATSNSMQGTWIQQLISCLKLPAVATFMQLHLSRVSISLIDCL